MSKNVSERLKELSSSVNVVNTIRHSAEKFFIIECTVEKFEPMKRTEDNIVLNGYPLGKFVAFGEGTTLEKAQDQAIAYALNALGV